MSARPTVPVVTPNDSGFCSKVERFSRSGFSLTEVSMALAIIAVAFVSLLALWPTGLATYRRAIDTTVSAQIAQRVIAEAQESDFDYLVDSHYNQAQKQTDQFYLLPTRYFDDQGNELTEGNRSNAIYHVYVRGSSPGKLDQRTNTADASTGSRWFTSLPSTGKRFDPRDMTILTVQVASNPQNQSVIIDPTTLMIDRLQATQARLPIAYYSTAVARSFRLNPDTL